MLFVDDPPVECIDPRLLCISRPADTPTNLQLPSLSETPATPAQPARPRSSRPSKVRVSNQNRSPRHRKRRAKGLASLTTHRHYYSLPANDQEYFDQVVKNLSDASYLDDSPQSREPTVEIAAGRQLIEPHRITGHGAAAARESVYAVLIHRPAEGDFVCWICGETRADRRLVRALDHVRGHFEHRPYHCRETHIGGHTEPASPQPSASVW